MQPSIKWTAPEYRKKERSTDWYWSWGIISLSIIIISIFLHNYAFAVLIAVAVFALITVVMKDSDIFAYEIGEKGIKAGKDFIAYGSIECFWIKDGKEEDLLLLKTNRFLSGSTILNRTFLIPNSQNILGNLNQTNCIKKTIKY